MTLQGLVHHVTSYPVDAGELRNEPVEVSPLKEQRHAPLVVHRRVSQHEVAKGSRFADELPVRHQVPDAQSRQERLREAADVDDVAPGVETLESPWGRLVKADVGLVVVLYNELAVLFREIQQFELAFEGMVTVVGN